MFVAILCKASSELSFASHFDCCKARSLLVPILQAGGHHNLNEYQVRNQEPKEEVQIYTWPDATLREITELVKEVSVSHDWQLLACNVCQLQKT